MGCAGSKPRGNSPLILANAMTLERFTFVLSVFTKLPFFSDLSPAQLEKAVTCFEMEERAAGAVVFQSGEAAESDAFYVIAEGSVRVVAEDERGEPQVICSKGAGDFFGEVALLHNVARTATIEVAEPCSLLVLRRPIYEHYKAQQWTKALTAWLLKASAHVMADSLRKIPFLSALDDQQLEQLGSLFHFIEVPEREDIFCQGDDGDAFYIISSGRAVVHATEGTGGGKRRPESSNLRASALGLSARVGAMIGGSGHSSSRHSAHSSRSSAHSSTRGSDHSSLCDSGGGAFGGRGGRGGGGGGGGDRGGEVITPLHEMGPGSYFGEMSLVHNAPRTAGVRAVERCMLFMLRKRDFNTFLVIAPSARAMLTQMACERTAANLKKQDIPFFRGLGDKKLGLLAEVCTIRAFPPHHTVFAQGQPQAKTFYVITSGCVEVLIDGKMRTLLGPGKYFGEVALVADVARTATVRTAHERTTCLELMRDDFMTLFAREPSALAEMEIRVLKHEATLKNVLRHPTGLQYFKQQLAQEWSEENIDFWLQADEFYT